MRETPNVIGARSEAFVLAALLRSGYQVLVPYGVARYDLAIDDDGRMVRIQVKTGRLRNGAIIYNTASCSPGTQNKVMPYTADEVDAFGVYEPSTDSCYLIPIEDAKGTLRLEPSRNNQTAKVRMAHDYLLTESAA